MTRDAETLEKFLSCLDENYKIEKHKIVTKYLFWQVIVKNKCKSLLSTLQVSKKEADESISNQMALLQEGKQKLLHRTEKIDETLKSFQPEEVFSIVKEMEKENIPIYNTNVGKRLYFVCKSDYKSEVEKDLIIQSEIMGKHVSTNFEIIGKYVLDIPGKLAGLCICKNDPTMAWIYNDQNILRKIYLAENGIQTIKEINIEVQDISLDQEGTPFVLVKDNTDIKIFKRKRKLKTFLNMSPHYPISIHITKNNEIVVGLIKDKECKVMVLSKSGEKIHSLELDTDDNRIFSFPRKITSNINGDILVADCQHDSVGRVVTINKDGYFNAILYANIKEEDFCPGDVATTSTGHIIVLNKKHYKVCVFTMEGTYLTDEHFSIFKEYLFKEYLFEKERDTSNTPKFALDMLEFKEVEKYFSLPLCIDADNNGLLLVGGETRSSVMIQTLTGLCVVKLKSSYASAGK